MAAKKTQRRPAREAQVGGVYCYQLPDGRFGACQVMAESDIDGMVIVGTLDVLSAERPTVESLAEVKVIRPDFAWWTGRPALGNYDRQLPWWLEEVAVIEPVETLTKTSTGYGNWHVLEALHRENWEANPVDVRRRDETLVAVDLGQGPVEFRADASKLTFGPDAAYPVDVDSPADFSQLEGFPSLTEITYEGADPSFTGFLERQPVTSVTWIAHGQTHTDLSNTVIRQLNISTDGPLTLVVPPSLGRLIIHGGTSDLTVVGAEPQWPFDLSVHHPAIEAPPKGLEAVQCLTLNGLVESTCEGLDGYTDLRDLALRGAPGVLSDVSGLLGQQTLRVLWMFDLYGLDGSSWTDGPDWPALDSVLVNGIHKEDAKALKKAFAEVPSVKITGSRSDAWIAANLNNPLRDWDNDGAAFGKAARAVWKKAKTAAQKLGVVGATPEALAVLEAFVVALNKLNVKYDIDTMRREEAFDAYLGIASDLGVSVNDAGTTFDQSRDF